MGSGAPVSETSKRFIKLFREGRNVAEIMEATGANRNKVYNALRRAEARGEIDFSGSIRKPLRRCTLHYKYGLRLGTLNDILQDMSDEQLIWLFEDTSRYGCKTAAEYITEVLRDLHAESTSRSE